MNIEQKSKYVEYISSAIRYAVSETNLVWPEDTIILTSSYNELSNLDDILGMKIYVMNIHSAYDITVAFPSKFEKRIFIIK